MSGASGGTVPGLAGPWTIRIDEFRYAPGAEPILRNLSFTIESGRIHHVCGPSGCGKSTLLALLGGQLPAPDSHMVFAGDLGGFPCPEARRSAQDPLLQIACATVIDELLLGPEYREDLPEQAVARALESLRDFRLESLADRDTALLSFGQARLVGLAGLWQYPAPVLLLDEPFIGLDARRQTEMQAALERIATAGTAVLLTHTRRLPGERVIDLHPGGDGEHEVPPPFRVAAATGEMSAEGLSWPGWDGPAGVGFRVRPGELLLLTGPNGAGKTQLLQHLGGLKPFVSGQFSFPGETAYVPQNPDLEVFAPDLRSEVMVGARLGEREARTLTDFFGLTACEDRSPLLLSHGQKKRVSLIGGLMRGPACLLLDEPLSGLDGRNRRRLLALLGAFLQGGGLAVIATHEPEGFATFPAGHLHLDPLASRSGFTWEAAPAGSLRMADPVSGSRLLFGGGRAWTSGSGIGAGGIPGNLRGAPDPGSPSRGTKAEGVTGISPGGDSMIESRSPQGEVVDA